MCTVHIYYVYLWTYLWIYYVYLCFPSPCALWPSFSLVWLCSCDSGVSCYLSSLPHVFKSQSVWSVFVGSTLYCLCVSPVPGLYFPLCGYIKDCLFYSMSSFSPTQCVTEDPSYKQLNCVFPLRFVSVVRSVFFFPSLPFVSYGSLRPLLPSGISPPAVGALSHSCHRLKTMHNIVRSQSPSPLMTESPSPPQPMSHRHVEQQSWELPWSCGM